MADWKLELIDKELEELFDSKLVMVNHSSLVETESRKNLAKFEIQRELQKAADRILGHYLRGADAIPETRSKVHAMRKNPKNQQTKE